MSSFTQGTSAYAAAIRCAAEWRIISSFCESSSGTDMFLIILGMVQSLESILPNCNIHYARAYLCVQTAAMLGPRPGRSNFAAANFDAAHAMRAPLGRINPSRAWPLNLGKSMRPIMPGARDNLVGRALLVLSDCRRGRSPRAAGACRAAREADCGPIIPKGGSRQE